MYQGSIFFLSLFGFLILVNFVQSFTYHSKTWLLLSTLSSSLGFAILAYDLDLQIIDPVLLSQVLFGLSSAINPSVVMAFVMNTIGHQYNGSRAERTITLIQVCETSMAIVIPVYAWVSGSSHDLKLEHLCMIGVVTGLFCAFLSLVLVTEQPIVALQNNDVVTATSALRWIARLNCRELPQSFHLSVPTSSC